MRAGLEVVVVAGMSVLGAAAGWGARRADLAPGLDVEPLLPDGRPLGGRMSVEETAETTPHLRAELPWSNASSLYGWGSVRLLGRPREDELRVRVIVDAPARLRRWDAECSLAVDASGTRIERRVRYAGAPMDGGAVYDAISVDLGIEELRRIASAGSVAGTVCGDPIVLGEAQLRTLQQFLAEFDELATRARPARETELDAAPEDPEPLLDPWPWVEHG